MTGYKAVAPMNGRLEVSSSGVTITAATAHLEAGRFCTLVIVNNGGTPKNVEAFLIEDALSP